MLCSWVKVNTSNLFVERIHFNTAKGGMSERIMREISKITFFVVYFPQLHFYKGT